MMAEIQNYQGTHDGYGQHGTDGRLAHLLALAAKYGIDPNDPTNKVMGGGTSSLKRYMKS